MANDDLAIEAMGALEKFVESVFPHVSVQFCFTKLPSKEDLLGHPIKRDTRYVSLDIGIEDKVNEDGSRECFRPYRLIAIVPEDAVLTEADIKQLSDEIAKIIKQEVLKMRAL